METGLIIFKVISISICLFLIVLAILTARKVILASRIEIKKLLEELEEINQKEKEDAEKY